MGWFYAAAIVALFLLAGRALRDDRRDFQRWLDAERKATEERQHQP